MNERGSATDIGAGVADDTARIIRTRLPYGALTFLVIFALAALVELPAHPHRAGFYALIYALEAIAWVIAVLLVRAVPRFSVAVTTAMAVALVALIAAYHIHVGGEAEILVLALGYLTVGSMVLFPWGWRGQLPVAASAVLAYGTATAMGVPAATSVGLNLLGLGTIAGLSVSSANELDRRRVALLRQTVDLQRANDALAEANRAKTQFLANVSHELRTPLDAMMGYLQLVAEGTFGTVPDPIREALERIQANSEMMLRLINDFLDLSRLEANRLSLNMEAVELAPVCAEAAEMVSAHLRGRALELTCEVPPGVAVSADRDRLRQVLVNLLTNAIKFTERGRIDVRLGSAVDSTAVIEVADTGVGIPPTEQEMIFEPFRRGARAARIGGVGIGLALSRQLTEAMGGSMGLTSVPGQGSTFVVRLKQARLEQR